MSLNQNVNVHLRSTNVKKSATQQDLHNKEKVMLKFMFRSFWLTAKGNITLSNCRQGNNVEWEKFSDE